MLNLKNTLDGYLKNVEVIGNTIQDTNNLADIRSVGDKVDGQELYKIDVVSCGKNIFNPRIYENNHNYTYINNEVNFGKTIQAYSPIRLIFKVKPNTDYIFRSTAPHYITRQVSTYNLSTDTPVTATVTVTGVEFVKFNSLNNTELIVSLYSPKLIESGSDIIVSDLQIEEGTQATPYEPYQENKLEILSPVQLEKVGDVADRIICKNGVWGVEKHISSIILGGNEHWTNEGTGSSIDTMFGAKTLLTDSFIAPATNEIKHLSFPLAPKRHVHWSSPELEGIHLHPTTKGVFINVLVSKLENNSLDSFKKWLQLNPQTVKYQLMQPQFIPLPHDQQIKLRTFAGQTNIFFNTEIVGQIKAQVPKSLGAVVNTHTEQIEMLHNALKSVLAGDMYTLATILYPEDFIQNDNTEQDIMVIPE